MIKPDRSCVMRLVEAQAHIPGPAGERATTVLRRGPLDVALSLPVLPRQQTPHAQDEIYFIIRGRGFLLHNGKRDPFEPGDLLFVAAGAEHQFDETTEDWPCGAYFTDPMEAKSQNRARAGRGSQTVGVIDEPGAFSPN